MDSTSIKSDIYKLLDKINDTSLLTAIKTILTKQVNQADFWEELPQHVKDSILTGMQQAENEETIPHSEVMKKYEKWLS